MARKKKLFQEEQDQISFADTTFHVKWRIGLYYRLSRDDGGDQESQSIQNQRKIQEEEIQGIFQKERYEITEYIDDGVSGTTDYEREGFQKMIKDIENKKLNCVVVKSLHRAFRNYSDQGYFLETFFPLYNIRFICLGNPNIDTFLNPNKINGLDVPMTGIMNDRYALNTSVEIRRVFDMKKRRGEFIGAFAPYGYIKNPENKNHLLPDKQVVRIIQDIFYWYAMRGISIAGIAKRLNEQGVLSPSAYKKEQGFAYYAPNMRDSLWSPKSVRNILENQVYIGNMVQSKSQKVSYKIHKVRELPLESWIIVEETHEPLVSKEIFTLAQSLRKKDMKTAMNQNTPYLFGGFLRCKDCKQAMQRNTVKGGKDQKLVYYYCRTYREKSKVACTKHTIKEEVIETCILEALQREMKKLLNLEGLMDEVIGKKAKHEEKDLGFNKSEDNRKKLIQTREILDSIYLDWKSGKIDLEQYDRIKKRLELQIFNTEKEIEDGEKEEVWMIEEDHKEEKLLNTMMEDKTIKFLDRGILTHFIKHIFIHEEKEITIHVRFSKT